MIRHPMFLYGLATAFGSFMKGAHKIINEANDRADFSSFTNHKHSVQRKKNKRRRNRK